MNFLFLTFLFIPFSLFSQSEDKKETWDNYNLKGNVRFINETESTTKRISSFTKPFTHHAYNYYHFSNQGILTEKDKYRPDERCFCCVPTCFQFDVFGNETNDICDHCQAETRHEFVYDSLNRVVQETTHTLLRFYQPITTYTYNSQNLLVEKKRIQTENEFTNHQEETTSWIYNSDQTLSLKVITEFNPTTKQRDTTEITKYHYKDGLLLHQEKYSYGIYRNYEFVKIDFIHNEKGLIIQKRYTYPNPKQFEIITYKYDQTGREIYSYKHYNLFKSDSNSWVDNRRIETKTYSSDGVLIRNTLCNFEFNALTNLWQLDFKHVYDYDALGNLIYMNWSGVFETKNEYTYDNNGNWIRLESIAYGWSHYKDPVKTIIERVIQYY